MAYDIFISYRRDGGEYTAKILRDRLQEAGYRVFFDVESLRSGNFNTKLYSVIDECTDFLLVLSPGALDRCKNADDWVRREIEYALERGKNVVPVMLRGFSFPEAMPEPLEPLRFRNGLEANSQFFDAFLQQLQQNFLLTKPPVWRQVSQSSILRRTLPLFLALALLLAVALGVKTALDSRNAVYPRTGAEKNLVNEVVYYAMSNLTSLDLMGGAMDDALQAAERYLSSSQQDFASLQARLEANRQVLDGIDLDGGLPSDGFLDRLADSPFAASDVVAMHDSVEDFWTQCADDLAYIESVAGPDSHRPTEEKLEIVNCYQAILAETLQAHAYSCNELLLPIKAPSALEEFWHEYLPGLTAVPLRVSNWQTDAAALDSEVALCMNRMEDSLLDLSALVGNTREENAALRGENEALEQELALREALIQAHMGRGYTREEAERLIELYPDLSESLMKIRAACLPQPEDDMDTLWWKMMNLLACPFYDDARDCVNAYWALAQGTDPYAPEYVPALRRFIDYSQRHGMTYGAMVTAYYEPDGINEVFQVGDVIVAFNGEPCGSYEAYMEQKEQWAEDAYTVEVLRANLSGDLERVPLELAKDMPRVHISTVVYPEDE